MIELQQRCAQLGWKSIAHRLDALLEEASANSISYAEFLGSLLHVEENHKQEASWNRRVRNARFPFVKTLTEFDFAAQTSVDERRIRDLIARSFYREGHNLMFLGPPGVGKSHLSVAIALEAIHQGQTALFVRADEFMEAAREAAECRQVPKFLRSYARPTILILDEVGYAPFDATSAQILFQVISKRYERGSIIITSNKSYSEWGEMLGSPVLATAILDRLLHHSSVFNMRGDSYRLKEKIRAGVLPSSTKAPRRSGGGEG
ncbi:AAA family ATPase [Paenibacillus sp. JMULE4]|uniref:AAA family ATPase n=1 Tax=Paenibacillus validus TaxID=44253 RepID=A0A7X2ZFM0_9BACL|nr:AAA family ATPase [Paenibacillus validus]NTZ16372.1 AAA family ATPase [Paenibacillus sp. JMULE4]NTZ17942.1 AAA family ATPase [Paenibacillus sp. JMULE4]NTZ20036.1 AAA family ATPase [Paenibacillus sp. JMULE4]